MGEGGRRGAKQREKGRARALVHHFQKSKFPNKTSPLPEKKIIPKIPNKTSPLPEKK